MDNSGVDMFDAALDENMQEDLGPEFQLTADEQDALGEVGNICMGTSATTFSTMLGKKVNITTPKVSIHRSARTMGHYQKPFLVVEVSYTEGIDGYNILLMKEEDVKIITDILMGGEGKPDPDTELDELHFSAISEVMNQMVGSASTSLSTVINRSVNISPPKVSRIIMEEENLEELICHNDTIIKISFRMEIEGILASELMQVVPFSFGKSLVEGLLNAMQEDAAPPQTAAPAPQTAAPAPQMAAPAPQMAAPAPQIAAPAPQMAAPAPVQPVRAQEEKGRVGVKSMSYQAFDEPAVPAFGEGAENLGLLMDVPLQVTVELGKAKRNIKEILGFNMGSVVVLDRQAGEMVDIMVNGKLYARGEVVVIDDNYGVRITDIITRPQQ